MVLPDSSPVGKRLSPFSAMPERDQRVVGEDRRGGRERKPCRETPISDSSYLFSGVPQCLGAILGLLAAFVALGSQMTASVYGVNPARILLSDPQFRLLGAAYVITILVGFSLIPLSNHPLARSPLDEFALLGLTGWLLRQTLLFIYRVLGMLRPLGMIRELLADLTVDDILEAAYHKPGTDTWVPAIADPLDQPIQLLSALARRAESGELAECLEQVCASLVPRLAKLNDTAMARAAGHLCYRLEEVELPSDVGAKQALGKGSLLLAFDLRKIAAAKPMTLQHLLSWTLARWNFLWGVEPTASYMSMYAAWIAADLYALESEECLEAVRKTAGRRRGLTAHKAVSELLDAAKKLLVQMDLTDLRRESVLRLCAALEKAKEVKNG